MVEETTTQETLEQEQQQQHHHSGGSGARSQLVQRLIEASSLPAFMTDLVTAQAITVAGTEGAGFVLERGAENAFSLRPIAHIRPDESTNDARQAALNAFQELIRPCIQQGKDGAIEVSGPNDAAESQFCLVTLLRADANIIAVSAVVTRAINLDRAKQRLMSMQLVAGYFELFTLKRNSEQNRTIAESHQHAMQLSTAVATAEGFESAAMGLCNELATRSGATRVSLGWIKGERIRVKALSHTEEFDKKQELIVLLERVMEECADQEQEVLYNPTPDGMGTDNVTRNAHELSRNQGGHIVLSLPLRRRAEIVGVVTIEFLPTHELSPNVARGLSVAVDVLAPQLYDRYQNDRWLITKVGLSTKEVSKKVIGPRHMVAKLIAVAATALIFVLVQPFWTPMYHVSSSFQFGAIAPNAVSAPFEGMIEKIATIRPDGSVGFFADGRKIKPGDFVKAGTPLVALRTDELTDKLLKARSEAQAKDKEATKLGAEDKIAESHIALDEKAGFDADVALLQYQIGQATLFAPLDGVILKGDLEDKLRAPVKQGDVMFEIGNPANLRAELSVPDRDMLDVHVGQTGRFATNALPSSRYDFTVDRIIPMGEAKDGGNVFTVYGTITDANKNQAWRPGMSGEARINVEHRRIIWIWTHRLVDFMRLKLWM